MPHSTPSSLEVPGGTFGPPSPGQDMFSQAGAYDPSSHQPSSRTHATTHAPQFVSSGHSQVPWSSTPSPSINDFQHGGPGGPQVPRGTIQVAAPKIEPQPWVKDVYRWLKNNTVGVVRVDLRRPTAPQAEQLAEGNILFMRRQTTTTTTGRGRFGRPPGAGQQQVVDMIQEELPEPKQPTGARIKISRNMQWWKDPAGKRRPLLDMGIGVAVDMDKQRVEPVARIKIGDLLAIKAFPLGHIKISRSLPLGPSGLQAKILYEVPLTHVHHFWQPPARLMIRLDNNAGSGLHFSPNGIEFDERLVQLGSGLSVRASMGLKFPRSLPIDPHMKEWGFKVHRLSLKSLW